MSRSGDNLFKNRPRASTTEYKQLPINLRLFQNTVKLLALGAVQYSFCLNIAFTHLNMLPVPMLDKDCLKFGNMEFVESGSEWFEMYPGTF